MVKNLHKLLRNSYTLTLYIAFLIPSIFIWYHYSALDYVAANYQSYFFAYSDAFLSWCAILLFPLLLTGIVYRSMIFGTREGVKRSSGFFGLIGGVFSLLITGASCCGITLISVFGMTSVIGFLEIFPYHGIELKILGILMLFYAVYDLYTHLEVCKIPEKHSAHKKSHNNYNGSRLANF